MTLVAPGLASIAPTVATNPGTLFASRSTAVIHSAAPAIASWRRCIGVVPAWLARPTNVNSSRLWPAIASTTPSGRFSRLQNRALLDVEFHVAQNIVSQSSLRNLARIQSKLFDGLAHGNSPWHL